MPDAKSVRSETGPRGSDRCSPALPPEPSGSRRSCSWCTADWLPADPAAVVAGINDPRVKLELPACQLEIATSVHEEVADALEELRFCRAVVAVAVGLDLAVIGLSTDLSPWRQLTEAMRLGARSREIIRRQLVSSLQVHLAFGDADCTMGVYHALRDLLPELAAVTGADSVRRGTRHSFLSICDVSSCCPWTETMPRCRPGWR